MFTLLSKCTKIERRIGVSGCGPKRRVSTMKSPSIESNDVDADVVVVGEEIGARKADTPIYNALKPSMRMIHMRHARRAAYPRQTRPANRSTSFEPMNSGYWNFNQKTTNDYSREYLCRKFAKTQNKSPKRVSFSLRTLKTVQTCRNRNASERQNKTTFWSKRQEFLPLRNYASRPATRKKWTTSAQIKNRRLYIKCPA